MSSRSPLTLLRVSPPGHPPGVWEPQVQELSPGEAESLFGPASTAGTLVVVGAHPDDETLGAGRLMAQWCRTRGRVRALLASDGEACLDHLRTRPGGLAERRRGEWSAALERLGAEPGAALALPDGRLAGKEETIVSALDALLDTLEDVAALATPTLIDPHPDHRAVGRAAARVARERRLVLLEYPVWLTFWADPVDLGPRRLVRVATDPAAQAARERALSCFGSQFEPLAEGLEPVVPPAMLAHHREQRLIVDDSFPLCLESVPQ